MTTIEEDKLDVMVAMLEEFRKMSNHLENIDNAIGGIEMQLQDLVNEIKDGVKTYEQNHP